MFGFVRIWTFIKAQSLFFFRLCVREPRLMCQAYIVKIQAGFTSSKELTMDVITAERWDTSLLFSFPQEMFTKTHWKLTVAMNATHSPLNRNELIS